MYTNIIRELETIAAVRMDPAKARLIVMIVTLIMFVIAAGAPEASIDVIR